MPADEFAAAVNVTACPVTDGFGEELSIVVLDAPPTVSVKAADVLPANTGDPL
jgi:hypothetical protein